MIDQLAAIALLVCGVTLALTTLANILGAAVYDLRATRQRRQRQAHPYARRYRRRPLITVLVMAQDDAATVGRCLDSLGRSSYRKLQIVVADNASRDATRETTRAYMAEHPKLSIRLVAKRKPTSWPEAIRQAYKTYGRGELIMQLNADSTVGPQALRRLVDAANDQPDASVLTPQLQPMAAASLGGLLHTYLAFLSQRSGKADSIIHKRRNISGDGACYRREAFAGLMKLAAAGNSFDQTMIVPVPASYSHIYAHNVIINSAAADSYYQLCRQHYRAQMVRFQALRRHQHHLPATGRQKLSAALQTILTACNGLTALLIPLLISYFIYLALSLHEPLFLMLSMALLGLLLLFGVWEDEQLKFRQRLAYSFGIPVTYSLFYGLAWIRLITAARAASIPASRRFFERLA